MGEDLGLGEVDVELEGLGEAAVVLEGMGLVHNVGFVELLDLEELLPSLYRAYITRRNMRCGKTRCGCGSGLAVRNVKCK